MRSLTEHPNVLNDAFNVETYGPVGDGIALGRNDLRALGLSGTLSNSTVWWSSWAPRRRPSRGFRKHMRRAKAARA